MPRQQGGLIARLLREGMSQQGGARGDGYAASRARGKANAATLSALSAKWRSEVDGQRANGLNLKDAMKAASAARKAADGSYKTTADKRILGYTSSTGREYPPLKGYCQGPLAAKGERRACASRTPIRVDNPRTNKRGVSAAGGLRLLRNSYLTRLRAGEFEGGKRSAGTRARMGMKRDMSMAKKHGVRQACDTREVSVAGYTRADGREVAPTTRRVAVKNDACADSWLYRRSSRNNDLAGVDAGANSQGRRPKNRMHVRR